MQEEWQGHRRERPRGGEAALSPALISKIEDTEGTEALLIPNSKPYRKQTGLTCHPDHPL